MSKHMVGGLRFVFQHQTILALVSLVAVSAFLSMPYNTLLPVFASVVLKQSAQPVVAFLCSGANPLMRCQAPEALPLGLLYSMVGVGAVIGALVVASLPKQARRGLLLTAGNLTFPAFLLFFAFSPYFILSLILMLLIGFSFVWQNALANTLLQFVTPDELRGRVMSVYTMTFQTMFRLGGLQAGFVADWLGAPLSIGIGAAASLLYGLFITFRYPKVREL
jgi:MFS family permease